MLERTGQLQETRRLLASQEEQLSAVMREKESERERRAAVETETDRLQRLLSEKEILIQVRKQMLKPILASRR